MAHKTFYGSRRGSRAGGRPAQPHSSPPPELSEASSDAAGQGGTPDAVFQSNELAVRGLVVQLANVLHRAAAVTVDALGEASEDYHDALRSAADILYAVVRK